MNVKNLPIILLLSHCLLLGPAFAQSDVIVRPHAGVGYLSSSEGSGKTSHVGMRFLLPAGTDSERSFGIELSDFKPDSGADFKSIGIVLEQKKFNWLSMGIATIGYFNYSSSGNNPVGLMANLAWEPNTTKRVKPYIALRQDFIFAKETDIINSLSAGLSISF